MTSMLPSAEVAADFKDSLEDLQANNRYEISNLTVIAKENTEHAMAISRVLENHCRTTPPTRKLPALYVLDSIVKNVGTPYTIYLGRNLYSTFMDAYTLVDGPTRKSMEGMLKTWKEPVPGSMESRPVFSVEVTRSIENALIKARTAFVQQQQQQSRTQRQAHTLPPRPGSAMPPMLAPNSAHPVPPPAYGQAGLPPVPGFPSMNSPAPFIGNPYSVPTPQQHVYAPSPQQPFVQDTLITDLETLIATTRTEWVANIHDAGTQQKLKALLDLQTILSSQQLPPYQRQLIKDQVAQLTQSATRPPLYSEPPSFPNKPQDLRPATPQLTGHAQSYQQQHQPQSIVSQTSTPSLAQLLAMGPPPPPPQPLQQHAVPFVNPPNQSFNLAELLAGRAAPTQASTPAPAPASAPAPTQDSTLLASLRAAGLLPAITPPMQQATPAMQNRAQLLFPTPLPSSSQPPLVRGDVLQKQPLTSTKNDVVLTAASIKIPRLHLMDNLFKAKPSQCSTCGRRFPATEAGKARKGRHLDAHFRTNQRLVDASKRVVTRSWYIDELEWIHYREVDDADEVQAYGREPGTKESGQEEGRGGDPAGDLNKPKTKMKDVAYLTVPQGAGAGQMCPICQESFEPLFLDGAQEWVWMDAVRVGDRVFHASCRAEVARDDEAAAVAAAAQAKLASVLGKRKVYDESDTEVIPKREMKV